MTYDLYSHMLESVETDREDMKKLEIHSPRLRARSGHLHSAVSMMRPGSARKAVRACSL